MGGTRYLKELMTMFGGRVDLVLASYNAGEGAVIREVVVAFQADAQWLRLADAEGQEQQREHRSLHRAGLEG